MTNAITPTALAILAGLLALCVWSSYKLAHAIGKFVRYAWRKWPIQATLINLSLMGSLITTAIYFPVFNHQQLLILFLMGLLLAGSFDLIRESFRFANWLMRRWPIRGGAFVVGMTTAIGTFIYVVKEQRPRPTVQHVKDCVGLQPEAITKLIAHRGNRRLAPDNTMPAIQKAKEEGFRYVEIDVFLSADHRVIVTHDVFYEQPTVLQPYVPQLTTVEGPTRSCWGLNFETVPYDVIKTCDVARTHENEEYRKYEPVYVPLLEDVLIRYGNDLTIFVELKQTTTGDANRNMLLGAKVAQMLHQYVNDPSRRWVTSFNEDCLRAAQEMDPEVRTMLNLISYPLVVNNFLTFSPGKTGLVEAALLAVQQGGFSAVNMDVYELPVNMVTHDMKLVAPGDYFRRNGVTLSTYSLTKTDNNVLSRVAVLRPDFYMSDQVLQPGD